MFRITLKGLFQHKLRFLLTTFAVVVGVSFVVATFTLTDTVRGQFDKLFTEINANIDLTIRGQKQFDAGPFGNTAPVDASILDTVESDPGVGVASGSVGGVDVLLLGTDGKALQSAAGGPGLGLASTNPALSQVTSEEGREPEADDEIAIDIDLAKLSGHSVGDAVTVITPLGQRGYKLVGTFKFGESNSTLGAMLIAFTVPEAQRLFNLEGKYQTIEIQLAAGADIDTVQAEIAAQLPPGAEVIQTTEVVEENQDAVGGFVDIFGNVLLGFGVVTLFVSAFLIFNTFLIVVGQRVRELALLRAVGASAPQVALSIFGEALAVGVIASIIGFFGGLVLAFLLNWLLGSIGFGSGDLELVISARSVLLAFIIGIGITLVSAIFPAIAATRVPPVAAMRSGFRLSMGSVRTLGLIGALIVLVGGGAMAYGIVSDPDTIALLASLGGGAIIVFVGVALLSAALAGPMAGVIGAPLRRLFGITGQLARENASREPSRTAFTAAALMVGLALVSTASVVGISIRSSFVDTIKTGVTADWFLDAGGQSGFTPLVAEGLAERPELAAVSGSRIAQAQVDGSTKQVTSIDYAAVDQLFDLEFVQGGPTPNSPGVLVGSDPAKDLGLAVGDTVTLTFQETGPVDLPVVGIHDNAAILGNWVVDEATMSANVTTQTDVFVAARTADGYDENAARAAIDEVLLPYPQVSAQNRQEFTESRESQLNTVLLVVVVFLLLAIIIAFIGILNTLLLAVFERTRELGLLRAVGQRRSQTAWMITLEAVIVSTFGAILGIVVGVAFGLVLCSVLPDDFVTIVEVPYALLLIVLLLAGLVGAGASAFPAWRASRLNVLDAIATD